MIPGSVETEICNNKLSHNFFDNNVHMFIELKYGVYIILPISFLY